MTEYIPLILQGTAVTVGAWLVTSILSLSIGIALGIASCRTLAHPLLLISIRLYTFITKGIPAYVQILIAYFALPSLLGIQIPGFIAASGALALCSSGYVTEIVRSGINAIPRGQWDACTSLGYPLHATLYRIILPQALKNALSSLFGELEQLLKSTSLLATIGIMELTRSGMNIISRELNPVPVYLTIAGIYLLFSAILQIINLWAEKRLYRGYR